MTRKANHGFSGWAVAATVLCTIWVVLAAVPPSFGTEAIKTINFQNADVRSVLNFLAEYGGVNLVAAPNVQGQVTLNLKNVEWRAALDILAKTYGLQVVDETGYLRVLLLSDYLKDQADLERHNSEQRQLVDLDTKLFSIKYASAVDMAKPLKTLMSARGKVDVDQRTNSLLVSDEPGNLARIEKYVAELDRETRQVKISAKLLEVSSDYADEMGISWNLAHEGQDKNGYVYQGDGSTNGAEQLTNPYGSYKFSFIPHGWNLDAKIAAIVSSGKGKLLAHPEITTIDNKEARIQVGQKIPIKQFSATGDVIITFEEVGTILRVTPHITSENRILLYMKPERSSFIFDPSGVVINTNNAETNVVVENGQTAVIGGLTTQDDLVTNTGVPVLKDVPVLGVLFRYKKTTNQSKDLVIFVTPTIVDAALMGSVDTPAVPHP
ncbi:MAG: type IV pilus secretin PilQ [candidate division Zixibacteria bacterium]|nr:type IV pilus secretin PilQ [candidate division Zixibacteria bacterium]